ncbi:hypothetical protein Clacol_004570 [Clathrus columnatus]|uniref:Uncharacterized protein n=1 Tax=Clathrus columnatus TaxID=1419009 RepID=A0AAV5ACA1_9AGAM|nr:hypothetical protein Clacol_004570 [Clathrus columnatus]
MSAFSTAVVSLCVFSISQGEGKASQKISTILNSAKAAQVKGFPEVAFNATWTKVFKALGAHLENSTLTRNVRNHGLFQIRAPVRKTNENPFQANINGCCAKLTPTPFFLGMFPLILSGLCLYYILAQSTHTGGAYLPNLFLVENAAVILSDVLAFLAVIRQVWGLRKEKRRLGLPRAGKDFATLLLQQEFRDLNLSSQDNPGVRPIQSVLGRLQERILADMGERNDPVSMGIGIDAQGQGEPDLDIA